MTPHQLVFDDAFPDPTILREVMLRQSFESVTNPVDQVEYPGIAPAPQSVERLMRSTLKRTLNAKDIDIHFCFGRMMPFGVITPNEIHHDHTMGDFSCHLYLNQESPPFCGTQFWYHPFFKNQFDETQNDYLDRLHDPALGIWFRTNFVQSRLNRILIHDSRLWHSASPNQGFGVSKNDARLVLTTFFDIERKS